MRRAFIYLAAKHMLIKNAARSNLLTCALVSRAIERQMVRCAFSQIGPLVVLHQMNLVQQTQTALF
jgi:hypothetical protein